MDKSIQKKLTDALRKSWGTDTGFAPEDIVKSNPSRAQCITSSLVVQDYLGGEIVRYHVTGEGINEKHYFNIIDDGTKFDTTGCQYFVPVKMEFSPVDLGKYKSIREKRLADDEIREKYNNLKQKVDSLMNG
jgi:uncharacterized Fe-S cluster-containing protein